jgi:hypothetical protein
VKQANDFKPLANWAPEKSRAGHPIPRPWAPLRGHCPPILGITLHRPWPWAFFYGGPGAWKDVENRGPTFPEVPAGTLLAIHTSTTWDADAATLIRTWLPECTAFGRNIMPEGWIVGVVRVAHVERLSKPHTHRPPSRWRMPGQETGVWLEEKRALLPEPVRCPQGWFGAWVLPKNIEVDVLSQLTRGGGAP